MGRTLVEEVATLASLALFLGMVAIWAQVIATLGVIAAAMSFVASGGAVLAAEQQRSAGHRADFERERERADQLVTSQDKLVIQLKNLRLLLQVARQDAEPVAQRTLREWWRWLRTTGGGSS